MMSSWPVQNPDEMHVELASHFTTMQELISGIRNIRAQYNVPASQDISVLLQLEPALLKPVEGHQAYFSKLARVSDLQFSATASRPPASASAVVGRNQVFVPLHGMIDLGQERDRLTAEIAQKTAFMKSTESKLANENFVSRAPADVVEKERAKLLETEAELKRLRLSLTELE